MSVEHRAGTRLNECVANATDAANELGGRVELGWQVWETLPGVVLEAEFHAIWIDKEGRRRDVTPRAHAHITEIAFLPDPELIYEGRQIDNYREAMRDDPLIHRYIELSEDHFDALNRGDLANVHGRIRLRGTDAERYTKLVKITHTMTRKYFGVQIG